MKPLKNNKIPNTFNPEQQLQRITDLVNFEGPLLTLYQHKKTKELYLFDWVDRDSQNNRWLIYRCKPQLLHEFIERKIAHFQLFTEGQAWCYKIDINRQLEWSKPQLLTKLSLPESYFPQNDVYFEPCDCPNLPKLKQFISETIKNQTEEDLNPKLYKIKEHRPFVTAAEPEVKYGEKWLKFPRFSDSFLTFNQPYTTNSTAYFQSNQNKFNARKISTLKPTATPIKYHHYVSKNH